MYEIPNEGEMKEPGPKSVKQTQAATSTPNKCFFDLTILINVADSANDAGYYTTHMRIMWLYIYLNRNHTNLYTGHTLKSP